MADFFGIEIKTTGIGPVPLEQVVDELPAHMQKVIEVSARRMAEFVSTRSQANAPILSDDLRRAHRTESKGFTGSAVEVTIEVDEAYALKMHEQLTPNGPFQLGPRSRAEATAGTPEGGIGGRYLARSGEKNVKTLESILATITEQNLGFIGTTKLRFKGVPGDTSGQSPGVPNFVFPSSS